MTFQVDMNNVDPTTFTTPEVNGTFNGWCGSCAAMSDPDGDNIWDVTIDLLMVHMNLSFLLIIGVYKKTYSLDRGVR